MNLWSKLKLLISSLALLVSLSGIVGAGYYLSQEYLSSNTFGQSEYSVGVILSLFWAGGAGFVGFLFLMSLRNEMSEKLNRALLTTAIIFIAPCVIYYLVVFVLVLSSDS